MAEPQTSDQLTHSPTATLHQAPSPEEQVEETDTVNEEIGFSKVNSVPTRSTVFEPIVPSERAELRRLASSYSRQSYYSTGGKSELQRTATLEGIDEHSPELDPQSQQFDLNKWAKFAMRAFKEEGILPRQAGVIWRDLNISGSGSALSLQKNVGSVFATPFRMKEYFDLGHSPEKNILQNFDGVVKPGELLIVLGRPGSGCSTLLKTLTGELHGLKQDPSSTIHYNGISQQQMLKEFKGDVVYNAEVDRHFPHITVGQTLSFASAARAPQHRPMGVTRKQWNAHMARVMAAMFGLSHTWNTKVGNDFIRGVSGGERKRVSIAEMAIAGASIAAWDNSTRGLDAATALEFVKSCRLSADLAGMTHAIAIYQASQAIYDVFDKAVVLYEGREIYFGPTDRAERYFHDMGWYNPPRQTTGDFLTSVTNPTERKAREGYEDKVPRTPEEFEKYWKNSREYRELQDEIAGHEKDFPIGGDLAQQFHENKTDMQAHHARPHSSYLITPTMQVRIATTRAYQRIWGDKTSTLTTVIGQIAMALIIGSIFYGTANNTDGFFAKGAALFFAALLNALISISEINSLYSQRPIVEKQKSYRFIHPSAEALAGIVSDLPVKFLISVCFNVILYFLAGLRYEPSQFFIYFLFLFTATLTMSAMFRTLAAITKTASQAMALAGILVLAIVIYSGFTLPAPTMKVWFSWIRFINPVDYAFEALIANEFHGRNFPCAPTSLVPTYADLSSDNYICGQVGAVAGQDYVSGDAFIAASYEYYYSHVWRNFGIMLAFLFFFYAIYLVSTELNSSTSSTAEYLVFRRGKVPAYLRNLDKKSKDPESADAGVSPSSSGEQATEDSAVSAIPEQKDVFTWRNVVYDIPVKGGRRTLLDNVSGWVKPGTLTALMGVSGAGKTTLLDVLAQRVSMGVVTGDMFVNGKPLDASFQRKTGYVQQQDLHLDTATVRESLRFSAMLRQPKSVSKKEKYDYVEEVIKMLNMQDFAEAVVGNPGEGLNVEQRKLLTIGVELAAKPALLLFLDEPTSGLDSQSSWAICAFLRKLADHGQAVLATIHQPSAILFQQFDRLLFLAKGGKTVYFGDIGEQSHTLLEYFEKNGGRHCDSKENPAEYMLEIIGAGSSGKATQDWHEVWKNSEQAREVQAELDRIHKEKESDAVAGDEAAGNSEFAMPFYIQLYETTFRVFQQYWRLPSYILAKFILGVVSALFISFSFFKPDATQQGFQTALFAVFMLTSIFSSLVQQIMPQFVTQRALYEVRERPSKAYSWRAFLIANIVVELPYQVVLGILVWASWYFGIYGGNQDAERQGLMLLFSIQFFLFTCTFSHLVIAALPDAETGGNIATLAFAMTLTFCGVMQAPSALPGFWLFMWRVSPLTYLVAGMTGTGLGGRAIVCGQRELSIFNPPSGQTCGDYLSAFLTQAPGRLYNPTATANCQYCPLSSADQYLATRSIYFEQRWRNYGIGWAYIVFNIIGAIVLYYTFRVRSGNIKTLFLPFEKIFKGLNKAFGKKGHKVF